MTDFLFWFINLAIILFTYWSIKNLYRQHPEAKKIYFLVPVNILAALFPGIIYFFHYDGGDLLMFQQKSEFLTSYAFENPAKYLETLLLSNYDEAFRQQISHEPHLEYRMVLMVKILSVLNLLTHSSFWLNTLYFSVISFGISFRFYDTLIQCFPKTKRAALISFFLWPGIIFWTSGPFKETLAFCAILMILDLLLRILFKVKTIRPFSVVTFIISLVILLALKYYYFALLVPILMSTLLVWYFFNNFSLIKKSALFILFWALLIFPVLFIHPYMYPEKILGQMVEYHNAVLSRSDENSLIINYPNLNPTLTSFIKYAPLAMISSFFRPFIWEINNWLQVIPALENLIITVLIFWNIILHIKREHLRIHFLVIPAFWLCIISGILLGLVCPNLGTLIRYKIIFYPFLVYLLINSVFFHQNFDK